MDNTTWIMVAFLAVNVIGGGTITVITLFINKKFDKKVTDLEAAHAKCEERDKEREARGIEILTKLKECEERDKAREERDKARDKREENRDKREESRDTMEKLIVSHIKLNARSIVATDGKVEEVKAATAAITAVPLSGDKLPRPELPTLTPAEFTVKVAGELHQVPESPS